MRIALFTDTFENGLGGITVYVRSLAYYLAKHGHFVKVFVWGSKNLTKTDKKICVTFPGIDVIKSVKGKAGFSPFEILKTVKAFAPDLIHNHSQYTMGIHAVFVAKKLKIPLVSHYHMYLEGGINHFPILLQKLPKTTDFIIKKGTKKFFNQSNLVIAPSLIMKKYLKNIGVKTRIAIVPFGIDLNLFYKKEKKQTKKFTIIHVGRLSKEKNVEDLIYIFNKFAQDKDVLLKIVGDGSETERLKNLVKNLRIKGKVKFLRWIERKKLSHLYNSSDVFITLSEMETFGIVILEAMACGLPIIGAKALAIPELVKNNFNGFLVDKRNPKDILEKLNHIFENKKLSVNFSKNSVQFAKRYAKSKVFQKLENIYNSILGLCI